jgi:hypothetical protein
MKRLLCVLALSLAACSSAPPPPSESDLFFAGLTPLCGKSYAGRLASDPATDADFNRPLTLGPVDCSRAGVVRMPLAVGEDRSRTWVVTRVRTDRLRLKHDHRHGDGSEDVLSQYGGDSRAPGTPTRQDFPADDFSKDLFAREGRTASIANVWTLDLKPGATLAYELNRPNRHFRVEFDLARPK